MRQLIFTVFLLLGVFQVRAQLGGTYTYQFLNLSSSPRQAALGGKVLTNFDEDVSEALYNPATINLEMDNQLSVNYVAHLAGINYGTASFAHIFDRRKQTFQLGIQYVNYGNFEGYDVSGNRSSDFSGNEAAISLGYNYQTPLKNVYVGANLKFITSALEQYNSYGIATDIGLLYKNDKLDLIVGAVARNVGTQLKTYNNLREKLPLELSLGLSQKLSNAPLKYYITLDNLQQWPIAFSNPGREQTDLEGNITKENIGFGNELLRHLLLGLEIFPDKGFNIRMGYSFRRGEELRIEDQRNFSGLSFGLGLKIKRLKFNYAYVRYLTGANPHLFGIQINLNK